MTKRDDYLKSKLHITYECFTNWKASFLKEVSHAALKEVLPLYLDKFEYAKIYCANNSGMFLQLNVMDRYDIVIKVYYWKDWDENEPGGWYVPSGVKITNKERDDLNKRLDDLFNGKK